jgi:hypothetical protein
MKYLKVLASQCHQPESHFAKPALLLVVPFVILVQELQNKQNSISLITVHGTLSMQYGKYDPLPLSKKE